MAKRRWSKDRRRCYLYVGHKRSEVLERVTARSHIRATSRTELLGAVKARWGLARVISGQSGARSQVTSPRTLLRASCGHWASFAAVRVG